MKFTDKNPEIEKIVNEALELGFGADIDAVLVKAPEYFRTILNLIDSSEIWKIANLHKTTPGMLLASFIYEGIPVEMGAKLIEGSIKEMEQME